MSIFFTDYDGMTLEECARVLNCSRSAVYDAEQRALKKLRRRPEALKKLAALAGELARNRVSENGIGFESQKRKGGAMTRRFRS